MYASNPGELVCEIWGKHHPAIPLRTVPWSISEPGHSPPPEGFFPRTFSGLVGICWALSGMAAPMHKLVQQQGPCDPRRGVPALLGVSEPWGRDQVNQPGTTANTSSAGFVLVGPALCAVHSTRECLSRRLALDRTVSSSSKC